MVHTRDWKGGEQELVFTGYGVSAGEDKKVLDVDGGDSCTTT